MEADYTAVALFGLIHVKPPRARLVSIINSSLFLWLLSAIVLTAGGTYLTKRQDCIREGDQIVEQYEKLKEELNTREDSAWRIIAQAKSMEEIKERLPKCTGHYAEYKDRSSEELVEMTYKYEFRVSNREEYRRLGRTSSDEIVVNGFKSKGEKPPTKDEIFYLTKLRRCALHDALLSESLDRLQMYVEMTKYGYYTRLTGRYVPACSILDIWKLIVLDARTKIREIPDDD